MQYMIMFYENAEEMGKRENPATAEAYWGAWGAYIAELQKSGVVVNGDGLHPLAGQDKGNQDGGRFKKVWRVIVIVM